MFRQNEYDRCLAAHVPARQNNQPADDVQRKQPSWRSQSAIAVSNYRLVHFTFYKKELSDVYLSSGLDLGCSAAYTLGLGALQVRGGDPALVVLCAARDSRAVSANNGNLLRGVDFLGALGRLLGAFATLAATLLLGEEGGNPSVVDEVDSSSKGAEEDEVEEDTG